EALTLASKVIPLYLDKQRNYTVEAYSALSMGYFLSLRCPGLPEADIQALANRHQRANEVLGVLIDEETKILFSNRAEAAVNEESFGSCGSKTNELLINSMSNSNFLISRIEFLVDIQNP
ncbi:MAG: hypothetical protein IH901_01325, partial [Proteobacteria bacterium]|nr:hypothetical protein [Pseudomonadota bacterium]